MIDARTGQPFTTNSAGAANAYRLAADRILGSESGAAESLDEAPAPNGNFVLALAARSMLSTGRRAGRLFFALTQLYGGCQSRIIPSALRAAFKQRGAAVALRR